MNVVKTNGFNTVRLPFSNQIIESPIVPGNIQYKIGSTAIKGDIDLNALQIMDKIVAYAGEIGLRIILDNHRHRPGTTPKQVLVYKQLSRKCLPPRLADPGDAVSK